MDKHYTDEAGIRTNLHELVAVVVCIALIHAYTAHLHTALSPASRRDRSVLRATHMYCVDRRSVKAYVHDWFVRHVRCLQLALEPQVYRSRRWVCLQAY
jgi:hypothetical protein